MDSFARALLIYELSGLEAEGINMLEAGCMCLVSSPTEKELEIMKRWDDATKIINEKYPPKKYGE